MIPGSASMTDALAPPRRALIADDDDFFRIALSAILTRRLGFDEVFETASLDEALAKLGGLEDDGAVALALFDLEMPGMSGAASVGAVRECFPDVRVAIVSASTRRRDILLALEAGAHGYVPKGGGVQDVARALDLIMQGIIFVPPCLADVGPAGQPSVLIADIEVTRDGEDAPPPAKPASMMMDRLTRRQKEVLTLIVDGKANKEIARALLLGEGTVKIHVAALLRALGVTNRSGAAAAGARLLASERL
jgi:DNA-binding NarL/FixJ family response regulator